MYYLTGDNMMLYSNSYLLAIVYYKYRAPKISGVDMGGLGGGFKPPEPGKMLQKNDVISEGSIFSNNFSKNI